MDLRYEGDDGGTADLELVDRTTSVGEPRFRHLCTLPTWHEEMPSTRLNGAATT